MGIDINIYHYNDSSDIGKGDKQENIYDKSCNDIWKEMGKGRDYKQIPEEQIVRIQKECENIAKELDLDDQGMYRYDRKILYSKDQKYPDHGFSIGYFYSSYNSSGINCVLGDILNGRNLYYAFQPNERSEFIPNWKEVKKRIFEIKELFAKSLIQNGVHRVMEFNYNEFVSFGEHKKIQSTKDAYQAFIKEQKRILISPVSSAFCSYSSDNGTFFTEPPLEVIAVIPGVKKRLLADQFLPAFYLVYKAGNLDWYSQGIEIIADAIEYICNKPDPQNYVVSWSG